MTDGIDQAQSGDCPSHNRQDLDDQLVDGGIMLFVDDIYRLDFSKEHYPLVRVSHIEVSSACPHRISGSVEQYLYLVAVSAADVSLWFTTTGIIFR